MQDEDRIANAVNWYQQNKDRIESALPITHDGRTFQRGWSISNFLALLEEGKLSKTLSMAYIVRPLREIRETLDGKPTNSKVSRQQTIQKVRLP